MPTLQEQLNLIHPIDDEAYALITCVLKTVQYKKGALMTSPGQVQRALLFVEEGIQMSYYTHDDKMQVVAFTYPPGITGIPESFLQQRPSEHTLVALTDSICQAISFSELQALMNDSPAIERLFRKILESVVIGLSTRVMELSSLSIEERFTRFVKRSPYLFQQVPHKYLASYLNINPTNFSKLYNKIRF